MPARLEAELREGTVEELTRLVGRTAEQEKVMLAIGAHRPLAVRGPAGIGKTSLVDEALAVAGRTVRVGGAVDFLMFRSLLPLERALGTSLVPGDPEAIVQDIATALGTDVLFLDDLQWADPETLRLLGGLGRRVDIVVACRDTPTASPVHLALADADFEILDLAPLGDDDVRRVATRIHPAITRSQTDAILRRAGGNPLYVEQLLAGGSGSARTLDDVLTRRLDDLSADARRAVRYLALAGRPLTTTELGVAVAELEAAGLVRPTLDGLRLVADLVGETAVGHASSEDLAEAHRHLATLTTDPGARARHRVANGELELALSDALEAAATAAHPGERARQLELAGLVASELGRSDAAISHLLASIVVHLDAAFVSEALRVADAVDALGPEARRRAHLLAAASRLVAGQYGAVITRVDEALEAGPDERELAQLLGMRAAARAVGLFDLAGARQDAEEALRLADRTGISQRHAEHLLAGLDALGSVDGWTDRFERALAAAESEDDIACWYEITNTYTTALFVHTDIDAGTRCCDTGIDRARSGRHRTWELRLRATRATQRFFPTLADRAVVEELDQLAGEPVLPANAHGVIGLRLLGQADRGDRSAYREICAEIERYGRQDETAWHGLHWLASEIALVVGEYERVLEHADHVLAGDGPGSPAYDAAAVTRRWARHLLGLPLDGARPVGFLPALAGLPLEAAAMEHLAGGRYDRAATAFADAARLHAAYLRRSALRCRLAQAGALIAAAAVPEAVDILRTVHREACAHDLIPYVARSRSMLRRCGSTWADEAYPDRTPPCPKTDTLTPRQQEILVLVADGWTSTAIARRLGIRPSTVDSHIRSAMRTLGVSSRTAAAMLVSPSG
jgi:DNA-binding CsgD family transcriptional regulator